MLKGKTVIVALIPVLTIGAVVLLTTKQNELRPTANETGREVAGVDFASSSGSGPSKSAAASTNAVAPESILATDAFAYLQLIAGRAYQGDAAAQYQIFRELDACQATLALVKGRPDGENAILERGPAWSHGMKERELENYRRCVRLRDEDPFAMLPAVVGGYSPEYWKKRALESRYPLALVDTGVPALYTADRGQRKEAQRLLHEAVSSGEPDALLHMGFKVYQRSDHEDRILPAAWMLASCRMGADCDSDSKIVPLSACNEDVDPQCMFGVDVEQTMSHSLGEALFGRAYAVSQQIEHAVRRGDKGSIDDFLVFGVRVGESSPRP